MQSDPVYPFTWEEAEISTDIMSTHLLKEIEKAELDKNQNIDPSKGDLENSEAARDQIRDEVIKTLNVADPEAQGRLNIVLKVIEDQILDGQVLEYYDLNNVLFSSLIKEEKTILGRMPKMLKRLILANTMGGKDLKEVFKNCCLEAKRYRKDQPTLRTSDIAHAIYPQLFYAPELVYMMVLMKEIAIDTGEGFRAFVGIDYVDSIADKWSEIESDDIRYKTIIGLPPRFEFDDANSLIERHVILDLILEDKVWDLPYIKNQFPYLNQEENNDSTIVDLRKKFYVLHKKYSEIKRKLIMSDE